MSAPTQSLRDVAEQVYQLLREFGPEPFERRLLEWAVAVDKPRAEFDAARAKHIFRAVNFDNRLCDQAAGPPKPDWEWESESVKIAHVKHDRWAWFPPELVNGPSLKYPLPLPDNDDLTLAEKYAALVAIHAVWWKGGRIADWFPKFTEEDYWICRLVPTDDRRSVSGWILYQRLLSRAESTPEEDVRNLKYIIEDVAADLVEGIPGDGGPAEPSVVAVEEDVTRSKEPPADIVSDGFNHEGELLTSKMVARAFLLDDKPLFSSSSLHRWEVEIPEKLKVPFGKLTTTYIDGKKVYKEQEILSLAAELTRQNASASQWEFDPSRVG